MDMEYSHDIVTSIKDFLEENDLSFAFDEQHGIFKLSVGIGGQIKHLAYIIGVRKDSYSVYAQSPISADAGNSSMMAAVAEFICRANFSLQRGNFELDFNDGEIRYKVCVDCEGIVPTKGMISTSIYIPALMFRLYASGLFSVIFGNANAKDEIEKCNEIGIAEILQLMKGDSTDNQ